jgi:type II secretory pathway pseudopilin PulG
MNAIRGRRGHRQGFTILELVVSAGMLIVVMTFVTTMAFRINQTWQQIGHQRIAMLELNNQIDRLIHLPPQQVDDAIQQIQSSPIAQRSLVDPKLTAERIDDQWGDRILVRIDWRRRFPGRPLELVAWLPSRSQP